MIPVEGREGGGPRGGAWPQLGVVPGAPGEPRQPGPEPRIITLCDSASYKTAGCLGNTEQNKEEDTNFRRISVCVLRKCVRFGRFMFSVFAGSVQAQSL